MAHVAARTRRRSVTLYIVEQQPVYREMYKAALSPVVLRAPIQLLGVAANGDLTAVRQAVSGLHPDVLLLGMRKLRNDVIQELEQVRRANSKIGFVLLLTAYDVEAIHSLQRIALTGRGGMALFLKRSLDRLEQLRDIILAAGRGQLILDPALANFLFVERTTYAFLRELTSRQLEILRLLAKGYTNAAIAAELYLDVKTVEHHINGMYAKVKAATDIDGKHPRVSVARLYLEATGELVPSSILGEADAASLAGKR